MRLKVSRSLSVEGNKELVPFEEFLSKFYGKKGTKRREKNDNKLDKIAMSLILNQTKNDYV